MRAAASFGVEQAGRARALEAILLGGLTAGILDGLDATIFYRLYANVSPSRLFQHIASGLLGAKALDYGWATVVLGVILHFTVATGAAAFYCLASRKFPALLRHPWLCGPAFGLGLFLFMQHVVVPLSAAFPKRVGGMPLAELADQLVSHLFFVGLTIAWLAQRAARPR